MRPKKEGQRSGCGKSPCTCKQVKRCNDCGQFVTKDRRTISCNRWGYVPLCDECASKYDDPHCY